MDLFHFREESPGSVFGTKRVGVVSKLIDYMRMKQDIAGYKEINTPEAYRTLWENQNRENLCNMYTSTLLTKKCLLSSQ